MNLEQTIYSVGEIYGKSLGEGALKIYISALLNICPQEDKLSEIISKVAIKLNRFPSPKDIINEIQRLDGRPDADTAWAHLPDKSGYLFGAWTDETRDAFSQVEYIEDDFGKRRAFVEIYNKLVEQSRDNNIPMKYSQFTGTDKEGEKKVTCLLIDRLWMTPQKALETSNSRDKAYVLQHIINSPKVKPDLKIAILESNREVLQLTGDMALIKRTEDLVKSFIKDVNKLLTE